MSSRYKIYVIQWLKFEFYNFNCCYCGSTNKTIMINRVFQYTKTLNYCRLCSKLQPSKANNEQQNVYDLNQIFRNQQRVSSKSIYDIDSNEEVKSDSDGFKVYNSGKLIRYHASSPKYSSFAEEVVLNSVCPIAYNQWNECLEEAKKNKNKIWTDGENVFSSETNQYFGIEQHEAIDIGHTVAIILFVKFTKYSKQFIKSNRYTNVDTTNYWFGRYLFQIVRFFGKRFYDISGAIRNREHALYHGISTSVLDSFAPTLNIPLALTEDKEIARKINVSSGGCVLALVPKYIGNIDNTKCISFNYKNHRRWLFMGASKMQIYTISRGNGNKWINFEWYNLAMLYLEK
eukprot:512879_1